MYMLLVLVAVMITRANLLLSSAGRADTSSQEAIADGEAGTIGSRLRKRRRTGTPPADGIPTASKRPNLRQTLSPDNKRIHAEAPLRETPLASKPLTNGKHKLSPEAARTVATPEPAPPFQPQQQEQEPQPSQHQSQYSPPAASAAPDLAAVIANIIDHGETVERHYANQAYDEMGMVDTESWLSIGASLHLKVQSLPILDNLVIPPACLSSKMQVLIVSRRHKF